MNKSGSSYVIPASLQPIIADTWNTLSPVFSNADKPQKFLSYMKGKHHNIKLIVKYPNYKTLPFLYCDGPINQVNFPTSIYMKKFTGPCTNYISFVNSSFINNSFHTLNFFTCYGYPQYILITLLKFL